MSFCMGAFKLIFVPNLCRVWRAALFGFLIFCPPFIGLVDYLYSLFSSNKVSSFIQKQYDYIYI